MKKLITALVVLFALPASAQQALTPLQQYLYNESGYAPPQQQVAPAPAPVAQAQPTYTTVYAPVPTYAPQEPVDDAAPDGYYEDEGSEVGPSSDNPSLRAMMTSSGF